MRKIAILLTAVAFICSCKFNNDKKTLPIFGNRQAVTKTVNGQQVTDTVYQTIPDFKLIDQNGDSISSKSLEGKIYVADFFFTLCPSICPVMHRNMLNVYNAYKNDDNFRILSYTIDPRHDTVPALKRYADKLGITGNTWLFLLGDKDKTYELAKSYLVAVAEDNNAAGGFMHEGWFVLIDKQKRVRGNYDGTDPKQVDKLIDDIKTLKEETPQ